MYTIERLADHGWTSEISFKTEFKAFINARTKCMATGKIYRVITSNRTVVSVITSDDCKRQLRATQSHDKNTELPQKASTHTK